MELWINVTMGLQRRFFVSSWVFYPFFVVLASYLLFFTSSPKCPVVHYNFGLKLAANKQFLCRWSSSSTQFAFVKHGYLLQARSIRERKILLCGDIAINPGPHPSSISCFLQNVRSLKAVVADGGQYESKLSILQDIAYGYDLDVICLTETWLNADVLDHEVLPSGYNIYRKDRSVKLWYYSRWFK